MTIEPEAPAAVRLLRAAGSPVRWTILNRLREGPCVVSVLVATTGEAQSTVSQHLVVLRRMGLVEFYKRSIWREYRLSEGVTPFLIEAEALARRISPRE